MRINAEVKLIEIYQCFCDETRLRIINLLARGPLCVCHLQELLNEPQVRVSKHLAYMKEKGVVEAERYQNWMIYALPEKRSTELEANLKCLQDCVQTHGVFKADLRRLELLRPKVGWLEEVSACETRKEKCCPLPSVRRLLQTAKQYEDEGPLYLCSQQR